MLKKLSKFKIILLAIVLVVVSVGVICSIFSFGEKSYRSVKIVETEGNVTIERDDVGELAAGTNMNLVFGDKVMTDEDSYAVLLLDTDKYVYLDSKGEIKVMSEGDETKGKIQIQLEKGTILNEIQNPLKKNSSYEIRTPNATMSVRGTVFETRRNVDDKNIELFVYDGSVALGLGNKEDILYKKGEYTKFEDNENPKFIIERADITDDLMNPRVKEKLDEILNQGRDIETGNLESQDKIILNKSENSSDDKNTLENRDVNDNLSSNLNNLENVNYQISQDFNNENINDENGNSKINQSSNSGNNKLNQSSNNVNNRVSYGFNDVNSKVGQSSDSGNNGINQSSDSGNNRISQGSNNRSNVRNQGSNGINSEENKTSNNNSNMNKTNINNKNNVSKNQLEQTGLQNQNNISAVDNKKNNDVSKNVDLDKNTSSIKSNSSVSYGRRSSGSSKHASSVDTSVVTTETYIETVTENSSVSNVEENSVEQTTKSSSNTVEETTKFLLSETENTTEKTTNSSSSEIENTTEKTTNSSSSEIENTTEKTTNGSSSEIENTTEKTTNGSSSEIENTTEKTTNGSSSETENTTEKTTNGSSSETENLTEVTTELSSDEVESSTEKVTDDVTDSSENTTEDISEEKSDETENSTSEPTVDPSESETESVTEGTTDDQPIEDTSQNEDESKKSVEIKQILFPVVSDDVLASGQAIQLNNKVYEAYNYKTNVGNKLKKQSTLFLRTELSWISENLSLVLNLDFYNWYSHGSNHPWDFKNDRVLGATNLYGSWKNRKTGEIYYPVIFNVDSDSGKFCVREGCNVEITPEIKEGYIFKYWKTEAGEIWDGIVDGPEYLTPVWEENSGDVNR